jgi:hypothetical protein
MKAPAVKLGLYSFETLRYGKIKKFPLERPGPLRIGLLFLNPPVMGTRDLIYRYVINGM